MLTPVAESAVNKHTWTIQPADYEQFSELALTRLGLNFSEKRRSELERAIRQAFAASTFAVLADYLAHLREAPRGDIEVERLINAMTVCETHFFRDAGQCDALYRDVLPAIIERRRSLRTLRIWSAGCASGEEPYSIAMFLRDLLPDVDEWSITILGTDVNTGALDRARKAVYGDWAFREERAKQWRSRFFTPTANRYRLKPAVQRMVTFANINLAEPNYPSYETNTMFLDLILCRNVTIYFSEVVTRQVIDRYYQALVEGGWLVVGHSEHALGVYQQFQVCNYPDAIVYRRATPSAAPWRDMASEVPPHNAAVSAEPQKAPQPVAVHDARLVAPPKPVAPPVGPKLDEILARAREWIEAGRSEQARDLLLSLATQRVPPLEALLLLGQSNANLGNWPEAEQYCQRAIQAHKLAGQAYYLLALVYQHQGRLPEAIEAMKKVVYLDHNSILGHFSLANLYYQSQQSPNALKSLDNARRLLQARPGEEIIPGSGGVTTVRLLDAVTRSQQLWSTHQPVRSLSPGD